MNIGSLFSSLGHKIAGFFGSHQQLIQVSLSVAKVAASDAKAVAEVLGEPASVTNMIGGISDALGKVGDAVTAEASATTFTQHATDLANLVSGVVDSGDIGIKNAATKAAIGNLLVKVQGVVGKLETAAQPVA